METISTETSSTRAENIVKTIGAIILFGYSIFMMLLAACKGMPDDKNVQVIYWPGILFMVTIMLHVLAQWMWNIWSPTPLTSKQKKHFYVSIGLMTFVMFLNGHMIAVAADVSGPDKKWVCLLTTLFVAWCIKSFATSFKNTWNSK